MRGEEKRRLHSAMRRIEQRVADVLCVPEDLPDAEYWHEVAKRLASVVALADRAGLAYLERAVERGFLIPEEK